MARANLPPRSPGTTMDLRRWYISIAQAGRIVRSYFRTNTQGADEIAPTILKTMNITEEAERLFKQPQQTEPLSAYEAEQERIRANMARQRAAREARETIAKDKQP